MFDLKVCYKSLSMAKKTSHSAGRMTIDWLGIVVVGLHILSISVIEAFKVQGQSCLVGLVSVYYS
jgi:hypothetical protein